MHGKGGKAMALVSQSELAGKIIKLTAMQMCIRDRWYVLQLFRYSCVCSVMMKELSDMRWNIQELYFYLA